MNLLENQRAADTPTGIFQDLEEQLMANIIRHCKDYRQPIATDEWLLKKLAEIGKLNQENIRIIARATGLSQSAMERMLNEMAEQALKEVEPALSYLSRQGLVGDIIPAAKSQNVQRAMESMNDQAKDVLNRCNTTMLYKARDSYKTLVTEIASTAAEIASKQEFLDILNKYADAAVIGAESRHQAMRKCIKEFNEKGIPAFVDKASREWTPEAYVNMAMRNTVKNVADEVQSARCRDYGCNLIEIDSHSGARPKCARDQGKIYDLNNGSGYVEDASGRKIQYYPWNSTSYGEPDGILGINCTHHKFPFWPGESLQSYFPTEDMDANDKLYKETQVQRALERDVRKQKRECMLYDQIGDKEAFEQAAVKLKQKEAKLKAYVDGNNQLYRRKDREQVVGFDKGVSARAVAVNKQHQKEQSGKIDSSKILQRNAKAADNWAKKNLGVKKTNYAKFDVALANDTNKALKRIYKENPVMKGFVDEIEFKEIDAVAKASMYIRNGQIRTKLTFSPSKCADKQTIQRMIDRNVDAGYWTPKDGIYGIAKHEATHMSEYALAFKRYNVDKISGDGNLNGAISAIKNHEIAEEIKRKALANCNLPDDYDTIRKKLCEYAAEKGAGEFLAEACSEHNPRKLAKEVQRLFREEMGK